MMTAMKTGLLGELYRKLGEGLGLLDPPSHAKGAHGYAPPTPEQVARAKNAVARMRARSKRLGISVSHDDIVAAIKAGRRF